MNQFTNVFALFDFILAKGDSAEIDLMRKMFKVTNEKIQQLDAKIDEQTNVLVHEIKKVEFNGYWSYLTSIIEAYDDFAKNPKVDPLDILKFL